MSPNILDSGEKHAAQLALEEAEKAHAGEIAIQATTDGAAEVSVSGEKGRFSGTAYARAKLKGAQDWVAGVRASWRFGKK